ncbi:hypothetical protein GCM10009117_15840 [Gangjinia marincola]|uniref:Uncharacterized protein n=1 Tax=Gangjinia marincola TaxID=578463 RepID=A0ABN1MHQ5_9FLAO
MKEEKAKQLISKSTIETSSGFTERLMLKIEAHKAKSEYNPTIWNFPLVIGVFVFITSLCIILLNSHLGYLLQVLHLKNIVSSKLSMLVISIAFLLGIHYVIRLKELQKEFL